MLTIHLWDSIFLRQFLVMSFSDQTYARYSKRKVVTVNELNVVLGSSYGTQLVGRPHKFRLYPANFFFLTNVISPADSIRVFMRSKILDYLKEIQDIQHQKKKTHWVIIFLHDFLKAGKRTVRNEFVGNYVVGNLLKL